MPKEGFDICPYDNKHVIVSFRMHRHMLKCRKNYTGPPLETCLYNATHLVPVGQMQAHLLECKDYVSFHQVELAEIANSF